MENLLINALAARKKPTVETFSRALIPMITHESDTARLLDLQEFLGRPNPAPLVEVVIEADPEARKVWQESLAADYIAQFIQPLVNSLDAPDVSQMQIGPEENGLIIFLSGGMSSGGSPSASFDLWFDIFDRDDNPYCSATFDAAFVALSQPFMPSVDSDSAFVSDIAITTREQARVPF